MTQRIPDQGKPFHSSTFFLSNRGILFYFTAFVKEIWVIL